MKKFLLTQVFVIFGLFPFVSSASTLIFQQPVFVDTIAFGVGTYGYNLGQSTATDTLEYIHVRGNIANFTLRVDCYTDSFYSVLCSGTSFDLSSNQTVFTELDVSFGSDWTMANGRYYKLSFITTAGGNFKGDSVASRPYYKLYGGTAVENTNQYIEIISPQDGATDSDGYATITVNYLNPNGQNAISYCVRTVQTIGDTGPTFTNCDSESAEVVQITATSGTLSFDVDVGSEVVNKIIAVGYTSTPSLIGGTYFVDMDAINRGFNGATSSVISSRDVDVAQVAFGCTTGFDAQSFACLFWKGFTSFLLPSNDQLTTLASDMYDVFFTHFPFSYITRFVTIIVDASSPTQPPALTYTFGDNIPVGLRGQTISFQIWDHFDFLESVESDTDHETVWEVVNPYFQFVVALAVVMIILTDLVGFAWGSSDSPGPVQQKFVDFNYDVKTGKEYKHGRTNRGVPVDRYKVQLKGFKRRSNKTKR